MSLFAFLFLLPNHSDDQCFGLNLIVLLVVLLVILFLGSCPAGVASSMTSSTAGARGICTSGSTISCSTCGTDASSTTGVGSTISWRTCGFLFLGDPGSGIVYSFGSSIAFSAVSGTLSLIH